MNRAAEFEVPRPLGGKPNHRVLPGIEIGAFDSLSVRDDSISFHLGWVSLQYDGAEVVPNIVLVRDRYGY